MPTPLEMNLESFLTKILHLERIKNIRISSSIFGNANSVKLLLYYDYYINIYISVVVLFKTIFWGEYKIRQSFRCKLTLL